MFPEIERTLVSRERIAARVAEMARDIARDLNADLVRDGHSALDEDRVVLIPVMTGAMIFAADLIRAMHDTGLSPEVTIPPVRSSAIYVFALPN